MVKMNSYLDFDRFLIVSRQCAIIDVACFDVFIFYYPRDAMLARVIEIATCLSVRLSVRHAPVLCQNKES